MTCIAMGLPALLLLAVRKHRSDRRVPTARRPGQAGTSLPTAAPELRVQHRVGELRR
ncbi:hypothetical protein [Amycolatopsis sp. NPDC003861]